ncbi:MAG: 1-aminocyclopropane-1-carboxylate deaminase/D-cysteine desulfhydrase [bacterium]
MNYKKVDLCYLPTDIEYINKFSSISNNNIYIKRDDRTGLALGGNKARKLEYFMQEALNKKADYIVTYGSPHSNHCRLTAAAASKLGLPCLLILSQPNEEPKYNGNFFLFNLFNAKIIYTDYDKVSKTIDQELDKLFKQGYNPFFIYGGGHGNLGTHSYVEAYLEIKNQAEEINVNLDYIFFASGTGTTQAGLIIGNIINGGDERIIGISIARKEKKGIKVIRDSIYDYCEENKIFISESDINIEFIDDYIGDCYGDSSREVLDTIKEVANLEGILLDPIYTGKAFYGMKQYLISKNISNKTILFIHTGGIPILFSNTDKFREDISERNKYIND